MGSRCQGGRQPLDFNGRTGFKPGARHVGDGDPAGELAVVAATATLGPRGGGRTLVRFRGRCRARREPHRGGWWTGSCWRRAAAEGKARVRRSCSNQGAWGSIGTRISIKARRGSLEKFQRLTGANMAADGSLDGGRRRQRAAHGSRTPLAVPRPGKGSRGTSTSSGCTPVEELGWGGWQAWLERRRWSSGWAAGKGGRGLLL